MCQLTPRSGACSIENEGLAILPPWQKLANFSVRAEQRISRTRTAAPATPGPVKVSVTVRYSSVPDQVAEVYEKYSHRGDLSSYVQTAMQEIFKAVTARRPRRCECGMQRLRRTKDVPELRRIEVQLCAEPTPS